MMVSIYLILNKMSFFRHINRTKTLTPRRGFTCCFNCDRAKVQDGTKCHICGYYHGPYRFKMSSRNIQVDLTNLFKGKDYE